MIDKSNLAEKFALITDHWRPRVAGRVNDCAVKLVKLKGDFLWHSHEGEDELFLVIKGVMRMRLRPPEREVLVHPGEFIIIPAGAEHMPGSARDDEEVHVLLFEPHTTLNTGDAGGDRTVTKLDFI